MICIPFDSCERVREDGARLLEADAVLPSIGSRFLRVPGKIELHGSRLLRSPQRLGLDGSAIEAYAASLLEEAVHLPAGATRPPRGQNLREVFEAVRGLADALISAAILPPDVW